MVANTASKSNPPCLWNDRSGRATVRATAMLLVIVAGLVSANGCGVERESLSNPMEIGGERYPEAFEAAARVLREQGFDLAVKDYRFGTIATRPLESPTVLEPWRAGNASLSQSLQSTINFERRQARVRFVPAEPEFEGPGSTGGEGELAIAGPLLLEVEVVVERHQVPNRQLTGSTDGQRLMNTLASTPAELRDRGIEGPYWHTLGRDRLLERRVLAAIVRRGALDGESKPTEKTGG